MVQTLLKYEEAVFAEMSIMKTLVVINGYKHIFSEKVSFN